MSRAYRLNNGDVITINDINLEYEDGMLYEVTSKGYDGLYSNPKWERTDKVFYGGRSKQNIVRELI